MEKVRKKIRTLFSGYPSSYGVHDNGKNRTEIGAEAKKVDAAWKDHFNGVRGIGQIPLAKGDKNKWGAIDIDFYTPDRKKRGATKKEIKVILGKLQSLPLYLFLSKTRSVHLYIFYKNYQNAGHLRKVLAQYATEIGYPTAEIFPKQDRISDDGTGNWINVPYFNLDQRRLVVLDDGKAVEVSAEDFEIVPIVKEPKKELPPCLEHLLATGVDTGSRNNFALNIGILYKKQGLENWQEELRKFNYQFFTEPLKEGSLKDTIRSLENKEYNYLCEQAPIANHCDKEVCKGRKFGIGRLKYDEIEFSNLKKILTIPPRYFLNVNGSDIEFTIKELLMYKVVKTKIIETLNILPENKKSSEWENIFQKLLKDLVEEAAPEDASKGGAMMVVFQEFLELRNQATSREDLLRNKPWTEDKTELVLFQSKDALKFFKAQGHQVNPGDLYRLLRAYGTKSSQTKVSGKVVNVWKFPLSYINEQKEHFSDMEVTPNEY